MRQGIYARGKEVNLQVTQEEPSFEVDPGELDTAVGI